MELTSEVIDIFNIHLLDNLYETDVYTLVSMLMSYTDLSKVKPEWRAFMEAKEEDRWRAAVDANSLPLLEYCLKNGNPDNEFGPSVLCPWNASMTTYALCKEKIDCLLYLFANDCPCDSIVVNYILINHKETYEDYLRKYTDFFENEEDEEERARPVTVAMLKDYKTSLITKYMLCYCSDGDELGDIVEG
jgi:hypothetical protein